MMDDPFLAPSTSGWWLLLVIVYIYNVQLTIRQYKKIRTDIPTVICVFAMLD